MTESTDALSQRGPHRIAIAGWLIIALAGGAAVLPLVGSAQGALIIAAMLGLAGLIETLAATQRQQARKLAMLAGIITFGAALLFLSDQATNFAPTVIIIIGWLFLRGFTLAIASALEVGSVRPWTGLAAGVDFLLAVVLTVGFSAATLVISLFGPTQPMVAQFSWILAISFIATGAMLLEVAKCARRESS